MPKVKEILKKVRKLEAKTKKPALGLLAGNYRSVFRGSGIEFSEVREYVPGDDVRSIDWNVSARMGQAYVKEYIEERNLNIYIAFDVSASGDFGSMKSKKETGWEIAASLIFSAIQNNDSVGLFLFTDKVERFVPRRTGKKHALRMLRELIYYEPKSRETDIASSLSYISRVVKKRSVIFVFSDFISADYERQVKHLRGRHDVILINLSDVNEEDMPDIGYALLEDEETGEQVLVDTSDLGFRKAYAENAKRDSKRQTDNMKRLGCDMVQVRTNEPFYAPLRRFLAMREKRMVR